MSHWSTDNKVQSPNPGLLTQTGILVKKNLTLKRRNCKSTCLEFLIPIIMMMLLGSIRSAVLVEDVQLVMNLNETRSIGDLQTLSMTVLGFTCGQIDIQSAAARTSASVFAVAHSDPVHRAGLAQHIRTSFKQMLDKLADCDVTCSEAPLICRISFNKNAPECQPPFKTRKVNLLQAIEKPNFVKTFSTRSELEAYVQHPDYASSEDRKSIMLGASFVQSSNSQWKYVIHGNRSVIRSDFGQGPADTIRTSFRRSEYNRYTDSGLVLFQALISSYIVGIESKAAPSGDPAATPSAVFRDWLGGVQFTPFPVPAHRNDPFAALVGPLIGLFFVLALSYPFSKLMKNILEEKESRAKEVMKIMGLNINAYWLSWFATYALQMALLAAVCVFFFLRRSLFPSSNLAVVFLLLWLFFLAVVSFGCCLSTTLSNSKTGSLSQGALFASWMFIFILQDDTAAGLKMIFSLFPPVAFSLACDRVLRLESAFIGAQSNNLELVDRFYSISDGLSMLAVDIFFWGLLAWYFDKTNTSAFGTPLPRLFFLQPSYWCGNKQAAAVEIQDGAIAANDNVQAVSAGLVRGVAIRGLNKTYSAGRKRCRRTPPFTAVQSLDLDMYEGQVFVLLGHNGAGKTTTINMLTGMLPISAGAAKIWGRDVSTDMPAIRSFLGICPQHDVLFAELTVPEHLRLYGRVKGVPPEKLEVAVAEAITDVQLEVEGRNGQRAGTMSGGQKRRLSMAIALLGDSKVVFLDEPTSGVDPFSRRAIWDAIRRKKKGRIIILTTHFMDEADYLGDRICIMHHGKLRCCGTSLFLKNIFGIGYNIVMNCSQKSDRIALGNLITDQVEGAEQYSNVGTELAYKLPLSSTASFPAMLQTLEQQSAHLGCQGFGLSVTTMEEVFLKVADEAKHGGDKEEKEAEEDHKADDARGDTVPLVSADAWSAKLDGGNEVSFCRHFKALLAKRWHNAKRDRKAWCCQYLVPWVILLVFINLLTANPFLDDKPIDVPIALSDFNQPNRITVNSAFAGVPSGAASFLSGTKGATPSVSAGDVSRLQEFASHLLTSRLSHAESKYGAICLNPNASTNQMDLAFIFDSVAALAGPTGEAVVANLACRGINSVLGLLEPQGTPNATAGKGQPGEGGGSGFSIESSPILEALMGSNARNATARKYNIFTNSSARWGVPTFFSVFAEAELRRATNNPSATLHMDMSIMPLTASQITLFSSFTGVFTALIVAIACAFVPAAYILFIVKEKQVNAKHLQLISGVNPIAYWLSNYVFDFLTFLVSGFGVVVIVLLSSSSDVYKDNLGLVVVTMLLFGLAVIPFAYLMAVPFTNPASAQTASVLVFLLSGVACLITISVLSSLVETQDLADTLRYVFRLFPNYSLGDTFFTLSQLGIFDAFTFQQRQDGWDMDVGGTNLVFLGCQAVVYFSLVLVVEELQSRHFKLCCHNRTASDALQRQGVGAVEDDDVEAERQRIANGEADDAYVKLDGLRKIFPSSNKVAVNDLSFAIPRNECFGFLGVNGAGKSTTLKILTADEVPTKGDAYVNGSSAVTEKQKVRKWMGYCPQFDAVHDLMSGEETLFFYGRLRGVPESRITEMVQHLCSRLTLDQDNQHKRAAGTYSGGNRRKLSVGVALIGNPPVVLLDEPSTGMDPVSRRFMWDFISQTMVNRAVILTTHSMEECEALCSRMGILVHGRLKCLGSSQHLKTKYGSGFELSLNVSDGFVDKAKAFICSEFSGVDELECYGGIMKFRLGVQERKLSDIFSLLETNRSELGIIEYSLGQSTLEQIFINFAAAGDKEKAMENLNDEQKAKLLANEGSPQQAHQQDLTEVRVEMQNLANQ